MRRLGMLAITVVVACAAWASSASALALRDATTMTPLPPAGTYNGLSSGNVIISNTFLGIVTTVVCTSAQFTATVKTNNTTGGVASTLDTLYFTGCTNQTGTACTVVAVGLPWDPHLADAGYDHAGLVSANGSPVSIGTGTNAFHMDGLSCFAQASSCDFYGADTTALAINSPVTDSIDHRLNGSWTNASTPQLAYNQATTYFQNSCASTSYMTMRFTVRTGSTVGVGNVVNLS